MVFFFCLFIIAWEGKVFNQEDGRAGGWKGIAFPHLT